MVDRVIVRRGSFLDSVALMLVSRDASRLDGVEQASIVNATPLNVELIEDQGFEIQATDGDAVGPNDLVVAVRARGEAELEAAVELISERLRRRPREARDGAAAAPPRSVTAAARREGIGLALVSVPGRHAAYECARALDAGLDVLCFSSGPDLEAEVALKARAAEVGALMMGPDCGTAILGGAALGFGNAVRPGPVGIVGASGTGIQALTCRLDAAGVGVSQAIGTGGRDLSAAVAAATTLRGIELLAEDPATQTIVALGKSPDPGVAERVAAAATGSGKPVVLSFPGFAGSLGGGRKLAGTLEDCAAAAAASVGVKLPEPQRVGTVGRTPGAIRGLFSGGTLRDEALAVVGAEREVATDLPERPGDGANVLLDLGDELYTEGRPHPMIDLSVRLSFLDRQAREPDVGVLLLDVVLGYGAHPDPASELAPALADALGRRAGELSAVVFVCGTGRDPQGLDDQIERLHRAGAVVTQSNADGARLALEAAAPGGDGA